MCRITTVMAACLLGLLAHPLARADSAAHAVPEDARVFIQIDNLSQWRRDWQGHPLVRMIDRQFLIGDDAQPSKDARPHPGAAHWRAMLQSLNMTGEEAFNRYLGNRIVLVGTDWADGPRVLMLHASADDASLARQRLGWQRTGERSGHQLYQSADRQTAIAIGRGWLIMAAAADLDLLHRVVDAPGGNRSLATSPFYQRWMARLPGQDHAAIAYLRADDQTVHAIAIDRRDRSIDLHYAGSMPGAAPLFEVMGSAKATQFGPLPGSTMAAITLNLFDPDSPRVARLDAFTGGKSFRKDILPNLDAPFILFLDQAPAATDQPLPPLPALGIGIRLKNPEAAADLDVVSGNIIRFVNGAAFFSGDPQITVTQRSHREVAYMTADLGPVLARNTGQPTLRHSAPLAFGRIDSWYLVTTHQSLFERCIDASRNAQVALGTGIALTPLREHDKPLLSCWLRPHAIGQHLDAWLEYARKQQPGIADVDSELNAVHPAAQMYRAGRDLSEALGQLDVATLQLWRGETEEDDHVLYGSLVLRAAPQAETFNTEAPEREAAEREAPEREAAN